MNQYTQLLIYLKQLAEADDYINTVTKGDDLDLNKANIFPMFNINIITGGFTSQTITFDVILNCLALRNINKEVSTDKFWEQDNEDDNHNETLAMLYRLWLIIYRDFNELDISTEENPNITKITGAEKNYLDGWELSFTVEMPNTTLNLCQ